MFNSKKRIILISPANKYNDFWDFKYAARLLGKKYGGGAPLALPTIAALTPKDFEVTLIDENIENIDFDIQADLIGITSNTSSVTRAYEIANNFKKRHVPVILGGIHVSMLTQEALKYADSVFIGEAEDEWCNVLNDFKNDKLKRIYHSSKFVSLENIPIPRWDLLKNENYNIHTIQTARGCPFNCEFCSVNTFLGTHYRYKKIETVLEEIKFLLKIDPEKGFFFADDNICSNIERTKSLFRAIIPLKLKYWWGQASINIANDDGLLEILNESGCRQLLIGFESLSQDNLDLINKSSLKVDRYEQQIKKIHEHNISIVGAFIVGNDFDSQDVFSEVHNFIMKTNISFPQISILTPLPGTRLFSRLEREKRVKNLSWDKFNFSNVTFEPKLISISQLQNGHDWLLQRIYSFDSMFLRLESLYRIGVLRKKRSSLKILSKTKILLLIRCLIRLELRKFVFILKTFIFLPFISFTTILFALNLHDFSFKGRK